MKEKLISISKSGSNYIRSHKVIISLIIIVISGGTYFWYRQKAAATSAEPRYVLGTAERGTLVASLTGTGQVAVTSKVEVKPQGSGTVTSIKVKVGQKVKAGEVLAVLDQRSAGMSVRQAQANLASAQASYTKSVSGVRPEELATYLPPLKSAEEDLKNTQNDTARAIATAELNLQTAQNNLKLAEGGEESQIVSKAYETARATLQGVAPKLEDSLTQIDTILGVDNTLGNIAFSQYLGSANPGTITTAVIEYKQAKADREETQKLIEKLATASKSQIDTTLEQAKKATQSLNNALTKLSEVLAATPPVGSITQSSLDSMKSSAHSARSGMASQLTTLVNQQQSIVDARNSLMSYQIAYQKAMQDLEAAQTNASAQIRAKEISLESASSSFALKTAPPRAEDITIAQTQVTNARIQLQNAQLQYQNTLITAPFDGEVAQINLQKGDQAGSGTAAVTLITNQKIAQVSFNEVDVAKLQIGQKATLTFDAIDNLSLTGHLSQIDTLGTVTQGVVNYTVQIAFDTQDDRVKPGMSARAAIIITTKSDVVLVPNSAVKSFGSQSYVEVVSADKPAEDQISAGGITLKHPPEQRLVEVGSANDTLTEIVSGLSEGESVITQTITPTQSANRAVTGGGGNNLLRGAGGAGGGTFRAGPGGGQMMIIR